MISGCRVSHLLTRQRHPLSFWDSAPKPKHKTRNTRRKTQHTKYKTKNTLEYSHSFTFNHMALGNEPVSQPRNPQHSSLDSETVRFVRTEPIQGYLVYKKTRTPL